MSGPSLDKYSTKRVVFGSLNGLPPTIAELPVDSEAAKIRYRYGYPNSFFSTFGQIGLTDGGTVEFIRGMEGRLPVIDVSGVQAELVQRYDMMLIGELVYVKEELLEDKRTNKNLQVLARRLYAYTI